MKHPRWRSSLFTLAALALAAGFAASQLHAEEPAAASPAQAGSSAEQLVRTSCAQCHTLSADEREGLDFAARAERQGPPLDFAGDKFRREWLVGWLKAPTRIRPAGVFPARAVVSGPDGKDRIDAAKLPEHPAVPEAEAEAVADLLMGLRSRQALVAGREVKTASVARKMGELNFSKFKGCIACHLDRPDRGGLSGPELHTAWERTTPEYLAAYIDDPAAWDRHTLMPGNELNAAEIEKLLGYLRLISEKKP